MSVHSTAIIGKDVKLDPSVEVGPYSIIQGNVTIGKNTKIYSNVSIGGEYGEIEIGENNSIYQSAVIGGTPQDLKYNGENTKLVLGNNNIIREFVTLNLGTATGTGITKIGNDNLLMAYVHVAHDCVIDDNVVIANSTQLAGHVHLASNVTVGGMSAITQFISLGRFAYIGGMSAINKNILPFTISEGKWAVMRAVNKVGLERNGFSKDEIMNIKKAIRLVIKGGRTAKESIAAIEAECDLDDHITYFLDFMKSSDKGIAR